MSDVVKAMVWLRDRADFPGFNEVYGEYFPVEPPTRSAVVNDLLPAGSGDDAERRLLRNGRIFTVLFGIVLMAMEKDRSRRYETANALASDIRRFLDDQPIVARRLPAGPRSLMSGKPPMPTASIWKSPP